MQKMILRKMTPEEIQEIDSYIPTAVKAANEIIGGVPHGDEQNARWTLAYHKAMDREMRKRGLRTYAIPH